MRDMGDEGRTREQLLAELCRLRSRVAELEKEREACSDKDRIPGDDFHRIMLEQRTVLDTANVGISLVRDRKQVWINRKTEEMFQYPKEELVGQTTRKLYSSQEAYEQLGREAYPVLAQGLTYETEQELLRRDGSAIWVKYNGRAIDPSDPSAGTLWVLEDITDRKQMEEALREARDDLELRVAERTERLVRVNEELRLEIAERKRVEEALRQSEEQYRLLIDTANEGIWSMDAGHRTTYVNRAMSDMLGYTPSEMLGKGVEEFFFLEDIPFHDQRMEKRHSGVDEVYERRFKRRDGTPLWTLVSAKALRDGEGAFAGSFAMFTDITNRKHAEEALHQSRNMLATVLDSVPQSIFWKDRDSVYMGCNKVFAQAVGLEKVDHIVGRTDYDLPWPLEEAETYRADDRSVIEGNLTRRHIIEPLQQADGRRLLIDTTKAPLVDGTGRVCGVLGVYDDVTERKETEEALRRNEIQLAERVRELNCLYELARLVEIPAISLENILQQSVRLIPPGFQDSDTICARIAFEGRQYLTENYSITARGLSRDILVGGHPVGSLHVCRTVERTAGEQPFFSEDEQSLFWAIAERLQRVVERMLMTEELRSERARLEALWSVRALADADARTISDHILRTITEMTRSQFGFYGFVSSDESVMTIHSWSGDAMKVCSMVDKPTDFAIDTSGIWAEAVRHREPLLINDFSADHPAKKGLPAGHVPLHNLLVVPFLSGERIMAVAAVANRLSAYAQDDVTQISTFLTAIDGIVKSKRAEDTVRESERRLHRAEIVAQFGNWEFVLDAGKVRVSEGARIIYGLVGDAWSLSDVQRIPLPEYRPALDMALKELIEEGKPYNVEFKIRRPIDGKVIDIHSIAEYSSEKGIVFGVIQDITHRKLAEEALRESEEKYRELSRQFIAVLEAIPDSLALISTDHEVVWANTRAVASTVIREKYAPGEPCYRIWHNREEPCEDCPIPAVMAKGEPIVSNFTSRDDRTWELRTIPMVSETGKTSHIIRLGRDISENRKLETQLRQAQKLEAIGTLAGGIAHDFNNILAPIIGYTEMALSDTPETAPMRHDLEQVLKASHRAKDLVRQILAFSRKGLEHQMVPMDISIAVKEALKLLRASIPSSIEISENIQRGMAIADATQIHQVLVNLCTNALQAMGEKGFLRVSLSDNELTQGQLASLSITDLKAGRYLKLTVSDTGCGMDEKTIQRIFDPYFTTKEVGKGTGLGLAVVHGIVKRHQGAVHVESEPGKGSAFHVYLPRLEPQGAERAEESPILPTGTERVLVVDDERVVADLVERVLVHQGYKVVTRTGAHEALETFCANPGDFDLIVTDYTMPHFTGVELAGEILKIRPDIPIILCTGYSERITEASVKEMGIKGYVTKPFDRSRLARLVRSVLNE